jgi:hypothetical protein
MKGDKRMQTLKDLLKDFAHDLVNHCTHVYKGEVALFEFGLDRLVEDYLDAHSQKSLFKWFKEEWIESPILWPITEEALQIEAEQEIDRRLSNIELQRVYYSIGGDGDANWNYFTLLREIVRDVANNSKNRWQDIDELPNENSIQKKSSKGRG